MGDRLRPASGRGIIRSRRRFYKRFYSTTDVLFRLGCGAVKKRDFATFSGKPLLLDTIELIGGKMGRKIRSFFWMARGVKEKDLPFFVTVL